MKIINFELRFVMSYFLISSGTKNTAIERYGLVTAAKNAGLPDNQPGIYCPHTVVSCIIVHKHKSIFVDNRFLSKDLNINLIFFQQ